MNLSIETVTGGVDKRRTPRRRTGTLKPYRHSVFNL